MSIKAYKINKKGEDFFLSKISVTIYNGYGAYCVCISKLYMTECYRKKVGI